MHRLARTRAMRWTLSKVLTPLDMRLRGTRFTPSTFGTSAPLCYLTTTGRRSGERKTVPLLYVIVGAAYAVVATNFGGERHPAWAHNLAANPDACLEIDDEAVQVMARRASDDEALELWPRFDRVWPGYEKYRDIAPREIMVFVLEPTERSCSD